MHPEGSGRDEWTQEVAQADMLVQANRALIGRWRAKGQPATSTLVKLNNELGQRVNKRLFAVGVQVGSAVFRSVCCLTGSWRE